MRQGKSSFLQSFWIAEQHFDREKQLFCLTNGVVQQVSLSKIAETALLDAIQTRRHGDALYFWVRMDLDPRNPLQLDFWSFCDSINAGNCK